MAKLTPTDSQTKALEFLIQRGVSKGQSEQVAVWSAWESVNRLLKSAKQQGIKERVKTYRGYLNYLETR
jgi:hypothetical protein